MGAVSAGRGKAPETGAIRRAARQEVVRLDELTRASAATVAALEELVRDLREADVPADLSVGRPAYREAALPLTLSIPAVHAIGDRPVADWPAEGLAATGYAIEIRPDLGVLDVQVDMGPPEDEWDRRDPEWAERYSIEPGKPGRPFQAFLDLVRERAIRREVELQIRAGSPTP